MKTSPMSFISSSDRTQNITWSKLVDLDAETSLGQSRRWVDVGGVVGWWRGRFIDERWQFGKNFIISLRREIQWKIESNQEELSVYLREEINDMNILFVIELINKLLFFFVSFLLNSLTSQEIHRDTLERIFN